MYNVYFSICLTSLCSEPHYIKLAFSEVSLVPSDFVTDPHVLLVEHPWNDTFDHKTLCLQRLYQFRIM